MDSSLPRDDSGGSPSLTVLDSSFVGHPRLAEALLSRQAELAAAGGLHLTEDGMRALRMLWAAGWRPAVELAQHWPALQKGGVVGLLKADAMRIFAEQWGNEVQPGVLVTGDAALETALASTAVQGPWSPGQPGFTAVRWTILDPKPAAVAAAPVALVPVAEPASVTVMPAATAAVAAKVVSGPAQPWRIRFPKVVGKSVLELGAPLALAFVGQVFLPVFNGVLLGPTSAGTGGPAWNQGLSDLATNLSQTLDVALTYVLGLALGGIPTAAVLWSLTLWRCRLVGLAGAAGVCGGCVAAAGLSAHGSFAMSAYPGATQTVGAGVLAAMLVLSFAPRRSTLYLQTWWGGRTPASASEIAVDAL